MEFREEQDTFPRATWERGCQQKAREELTPRAFVSLAGDGISWLVAEEGEERHRRHGHRDHRGRQVHDDAP